MATEDTTPTGPDLAIGVELDAIPEGGSLLGHAHGEAVLLVRTGDEVFAIGPKCSHYGGPLAEGLVIGCQVRCPWHHARFDLRTGDAVEAPALDALPCWEVERSGARVRVGVRRPREEAALTRREPESVVIVGAGAAGNACAEMLRRQGYAGPVTMFDAEESAPVDRPNLSKDYLAGTAPEAWVTLRDGAFFAAQGIELVVGTRVVALDTEAREVRLADGSTRRYGALLLATGADPVRLRVPGADGDHVFNLRSLADSRAIIARAATARRAVVVGASFIGLEVAASLRTRGLEVTVVAPEARPLERVLGPELGDFLRALHEEHGVVFRLGHTLARIEAEAVVLDDGARLPADLVVVGVGVRPALELAERAGLALDRGVIVNERLETSAPGVFAAGDIARWPDEHAEGGLRIEHWVVAQRQGQLVARNMLGAGERFHAAPFFWSQHHDVVIAYVGHAASWDRVELIGSLAAGDCMLVYHQGTRIAAVATLFRDGESLAAEDLLERGDQAGLAALVARARA